MGGKEGRYAGASAEAITGGRFGHGCRPAGWPKAALLEDGRRRGAARLGL